MASNIQMGVTSFSLLFDLSKMGWTYVMLCLVVVYACVRFAYHLFFHPLAKYPGPKLAAVSNAWYAYHWITGRYPWAIEQALQEYGDIVRIAPNEVVFLNPNAAVDIHGSHIRNKELFVKTNFQDIGAGDGGISWEKDPVRHREVSKRLSPAFSAKSIKAKESTLQKHVDLFIDRMRTYGGQSRGVELKTWTDWLALDIAADLAYNRQLHQVELMKSSELLDSINGVNFFGTMNQIMKKFPLLTPLMFLVIPVSVIRSLPRVLALNSKEVQARIERRGKTEHLDYFEQLCPEDGVVPTDKKHRAHLEQVAGQLMLAGFDPIANQFYSTIYFLTQEPQVFSILKKEIRDTFKNYDDINPDGLAPLRFLHACLQETLRLHTNASFGMPRISPGAKVDGTYVPKGVVCQIANFAAAHSPRYFKEPRRYQPQRWLPPTHAHYDEAFQHDHLKGFWPFSQGPRMCPGRESAWVQTKLFIAKVVWSFDLEMVPGQDYDWERDMKHYSMWQKPELFIKFIPVDGEKRREVSGL